MTPSFDRRNERTPTWGDGDPRGVDWCFVAFAIGWTAFMALAAYVGLAR